MIFRPELADLILAGRKTQTRRRNLGRYRASRTYAVQPGRGRRAVGHIRILDVRRELLKDVDEQDARCEGFANRATFLAYWRALHGEIEWDLVVDVLTFALTERAE